MFKNNLILKIGYIFSAIIFGLVIFKDNNFLKKHSNNLIIQEKIVPIDPEIQKKLIKDLDGYKLKSIDCYINTDFVNEFKNIVGYFIDNHDLIHVYLSNGELYILHSINCKISYTKN